MSKPSSNNPTTDVYDSSAIDDLSKAGSTESAIRKIEVGFEIVKWPELDPSIKYKALNSMKLLAIKYGLIKDVHEIDKLVQDGKYDSFVQYLNSKVVRK